MQLFRREQAWGLELSGFGRPMGLGRDRAGRWLVTDMDCHVVVRLDAGLVRFQWHAGESGGWSDWTPVQPGAAASRPKRAPAGFDGPHAVSEDAAGWLIVTCYYTPRIVAVALDGAVRELAGRPLLQGPATTRIDAHGRLLVAEYAQNEVLVLDDQGRCQDRVAHGFDRLHMALPLRDGGLVVADTWNHRLLRLDAEGRCVAGLVDERGWQAGPSAAGRPDGAIDHPVALDLDDHDRLLVTCWGSGRVLLRDPAGKPLELTGIPPLEKPYDARFTDRGIVVADTHHGRVLVVDNTFQPSTPPP